MYFLGTANTQLKNTPDVIVFMGGAGMPNEENLMRLYYTAYFASEFEDSRIILALPGDTTDSTSAINLLRTELANRGINKERILFENKGLNTRHQALQISSMMDTSQTILLITSPFHMFRSRLVFEKTGFHHVGGAATFNGYISHDILFDDSILGGNKMIPDIGNYAQLRYQFWNHLKYEIEIAREIFALVYYKVKGWI
jgi:uncharacterized SAM-binding protein YcdF (DUF218 family)